MIPIGHYHFNRDNAITRQPWFETSCCPTNVVRLLPSLSGYIYAVRDADVYVNLYIASQGTVSVGEKTIAVEQYSHYPWDGRIRLTIRTDQPQTFTLNLRIPGWAQNQPLPGHLYRYVDPVDQPVTITVDDAAIPINIHQGYVRISREWGTETQIELHLPLAVRRVTAHEKAADLTGKVALERGPIVYAVETADNPTGVLDLQLADDTALSTVHRPDLLQGMVCITGQALDGQGGVTDFTAIPYYAWAHRSIGEMTVWLSRR